MPDYPGFYSNLRKTCLEICDRINRGGWTVVRDPEGRIGPYAYNDRQWVSYDDVEDIRRKTKFVTEMGLGGAMIW